MTELVAGNAICVPATVPYRITHGTDGMVHIYWVYVGRDMTRTITSPGETVAVMSSRDRPAVALA